MPSVGLHVAPPSNNDFYIENYFTASAVKNTSQLASHRTETETRLLMIPGVQCASLAALGSLASRSSIVLLVNILDPVGWRIFFVGSCVTDSMAGAPLANNDTFAAESTSAVVFISGGLAHPGWR